MNIEPVALSEEKRCRMFEAESVRRTNAVYRFQ